MPAVNTRGIGSISTLVAFIILISPRAVSGICYYPNGAVTNQDIPCTSGNGQASACCAPGFACLSNGLCLQPDAKNDTVGYSRGSCTDKNWRSPSCPAFCIHSGAPENDVVNNKEPVRKCENTTEDIYYCVNDNVDAVNCAQKKNIVSFAGQPTTITVVGASSTASATATSTGSHAGHNRDVALGAGIGVGGGVLALSGAVWFWLRRRARRKATPYGSLAGPSPGLNDEGGSDQPSDKMSREELAGSALVEMDAIEAQNPHSPYQDIKPLEPPAELAGTEIAELPAGSDEGRNNTPRQAEATQ